MKTIFFDRVGKVFLIVSIALAISVSLIAEDEIENVDPPESITVVKIKDARKKLLEMNYYTRELESLRCPRKGSKKEWILTMGFPLNPIDENVWIFAREEKFYTRKELKTWKDVEEFDPEHQVGLLLVVFENGRALNNVYCKVLDTDIFGVVEQVYRNLSHKFKTTNIVPAEYKK